MNRQPFFNAVQAERWAKQSFKEAFDMHRSTIEAHLSAFEHLKESTTGPGTIL